MLFPCRHSTSHRAQQKQGLVNLSLTCHSIDEGSFSSLKSWSRVHCHHCRPYVSIHFFPLCFIFLTSKDQPLLFTLFLKSSDDSDVWVEGICHRYCSSFSFKRRICAKCTAELYKSHTHQCCHIYSDEGERNKLLANRTDSPFFSDMSACLYCQLSWNHLSLLPASWVKQESGTEKEFCQVNYFRKRKTLSWDPLWILLWCLLVTLSSPVVTGVEAPQSSQLA